MPSTYIAGSQVEHRDAETTNTCELAHPFTASNYEGNSHFVTSRHVHGTRPQTGSCQRENE